MIFRRLKDYILGIDGLFLAVAALVLGASLYYFFQDDGLTGASKIEMTPVGQFAASRNDVRRRIQSGFAWATVAPNDVVFEGDSIFTGEESDANIQLSNGGRIQIDPKSLVVVKTQGKGLRLDLQYGSLVGKVNKETPLFIAQNGRLQELSAKDAEVRIESAGPDQETKIEVVKGEVEMRAVTAKAAVASRKKAVKPKAIARPSDVEEEPTAAAVAPQIIRQSEVVQIKPSAAPVIQKVAITLLSPENGKTVWLPLGQGIEFRWKLTGSSSAVKSRIEFSRDLQFDPPAFSAEVAGVTFALPDDKRPTGTFNWRVHPIGGGSTALLPSAPSRLTVFPDVPPLPAFPGDGQEFAFNPEDGEKGKQVLMSWEDQAGSSEFELQLASDSEFKKILMEKKTAANSEKTALLTAGTYFWKVKGLNPQRSAPPWSRTMRFSVEEAAKRPDTPVFKQTLLEYEIPSTALDRVTTSSPWSGPGVAIDPNSSERITPFRWSEVSSAEAYEIEMSGNEVFSNSIKLDTGKDLQFAPKAVKPGSVFVRVRAKGRKGLVSPPSQIGRLDVKLPAPLLSPPQAVSEKFKSEEEFAKGRHEFNLKWTARPFASTYELQWGADNDFKQSKKFRLQESERKITVTKSMNYTARVRALAPDGTAISEFSPPVTASYRKELLPLPVVVAARPVSEKPKPSATVENVNAARNPAASKVGGLAAGGAINLPVPTPQFPRPKTSFLSLENSVSFMNFKWKPVMGAKYYEVQIAADADFTKIVDTFTSESSAYTFKKPLPEGRIFWRVRAVSATRSSEWSPVFDVDVLYE